MKPPIHTDVLILGCGIAGGTAALELADAGLDVVIVTRADEAGGVEHLLGAGRHHLHGRGRFARSCWRRTSCAPGRASAASRRSRSWRAPGPRWCSRVLIDRLKVPFDREPDGSLALGREGGHSLPRIVHAADATGRAIENALIAELRRHPHVRS